VSGSSATTLGTATASNGSSPTGGEHGAADLGTDLIAIEHDGTVWAIQVKCYDERYQVTKADIDSFLS